MDPGILDWGPNSNSKNITIESFWQCIISPGFFIKGIKQIDWL